MTAVTDTDINTYFNAAEEVARMAGKRILDDLSKDKLVDTKSAFADLVTESDLAVEEIIISDLKSKFSTHSFIGEESSWSAGTGKRVDWTDNPTWIIDPIDGTTNFVHRFPHSAVSIGLTINKRVEVGIIYNPMLDQMFTAKRGQGAFCNGKRLHVSKTTELCKSLICMEFSSDRDPHSLDIRQKNMRTVMDKAHGIRNLGAATLDLAMVASGAADAFYNVGLDCWDMAAGSLLVEEAGGVLFKPDGTTFDLMSRRILCACSESLAKRLAPCLQPINYNND